MTETRIACPVCANPAPHGPVRHHAPFCSERCRRVDLARWLDAQYCISVPLCHGLQDDLDVLASLPPELLEELEAEL